MTTKEREMRTFTAKEVAQVCDHTFLKRTEAYKIHLAQDESPVRKRETDFFAFIKRVCGEALKPYAICIRSEDVPHAYSCMRKELGFQLPIAATVGFPDGHWIKSSYKFFEAQFAMGEGAQEVDVVMNYQALKEGNHSLVFHEIQAITKMVHSHKGKVKLIIETSELNGNQVLQACQIASHAGVDFIKTSTGYGACGVRLDSLETIFRNFRGGIKISGGITMENVHKFLSIANNVLGEAFQLVPDKFRIGESLLLEKLQSPLTQEQ